MKDNRKFSLGEAVSLNDGMCGLEYLGWKGQVRGSNEVSERPCC